MLFYVFKCRLSLLTIRFLLNIFIFINEFKMILVYNPPRLKY